MTALKTKNTTKKIKSMQKGKQRDLIFYIAFMAWPVLQFCVFYIGVNFQSVLLAFQKIDLLSNTVTWTLDNFKNAFNFFVAPENTSMWAMSLMSYAVITVISPVLAMMFSYYIFKKFRGASMFRIVLFLPSIIPGIVLITIYKYFAELAVPEIANSAFGIAMRGLLENPDTQYWTIIFFAIWAGFGSSVLMYSNAMSGISPDIIEAGHLEGCTGIKECLYILVPLIYPTITTFLVVGVATIFTGQYNLFSFFGKYAPERLVNFGYHLYVETLSATSKAEYPLLAAMGLLLTCIAAPLTLGVKALFNRFDPYEEHIKKDKKVKKEVLGNDK